MAALTLPLGLRACKMGGVQPILRPSYRGRHALKSTPGISGISTDEHGMAKIRAVLIQTLFRGASWRLTTLSNVKCQASSLHMLPL